MGSLFGKKCFLTRMARIALILTSLLPAAVFAQDSNDDPVNLDSGRLELRDPQTGELTVMTFSTKNVGDLKNATPEQLNQMNSDLRENSNEFSDGSLTVIQGEHDPAQLPAAVTAGMPLNQVQVPEKLTNAFSDLENRMDQAGIEAKPGFFQRQVKNIKQNVGETSIKDWVFVAVFIATPRVAIGSYIAAQSHTLPYVLTMATAIAATTFINNAFHKPIDKWATKGAINPERSLLNKDRLKVWYQYWKFDLIIDGVMGLISRRNSPSQIFFDSFPKLTNNFVSVQKSSMFKLNRELRRTFSLIPLVGITIAQQMNNSVAQKPIVSWTLGHNSFLDMIHLSGYSVYEFRPSTALTAGIYLGLIGLNAAFPKVMTKFTNFLLKITDPITNRISKGFIKAFNLKITPTDPCGKAMKDWKSMDEETRNIESITDEI